MGNPNNFPCNKRIDELDFMKFVFIVLMIAFHLTYISSLYPELKRFVYTFHMPAFLVISGFVMNIQKTPRKFARTMWWLFVPYVVMESGYILMASALPIKEHIAHLTPLVFVQCLVVHPLGPYWYLQTLIVCGCIYYGIFATMPRLPIATKILMIWVSYFICSKLEILSLSCGCFFLAGVAIKQLGFKLHKTLALSWWALVGMAIIASDVTHYDRNTVYGIAIVYLAMSISVFIFGFIKGTVRFACLYIGRHTLSIILFSPIFTLLCKPLVPLFSFDKTGMLFLIIAQIIVLSGSIGISLIMDYLHISPYFFGKYVVFDRRK